MPSGVSTNGGIFREQGCSRYFLKPLILNWFEQHVALQNAIMFDFPC